MSGAIPPLPNTHSWRGAHLKKKSTGTNLPFGNEGSRPGILIQEILDQEQLTQRMFIWQGNCE
jgi:hypothetical protein